MGRTRAPLSRQRTPRILHAPANISGIAGLLARAQRDLGLDSTSVEYYSHPFKFGADRTLGLRAGDSTVKKAAAMGMFTLDAVRRYDVFHLYFGSTLLPRPNPDLPLLRSLGKRIVFHYCGCDVRQRGPTLSRYALSGCTDCISRICLHMSHPNHAPTDVVFVSTPDLLEFVPGAHLLPGPVDLEQWTPKATRLAPVSHSDPVRIVHAPSDREIKGTGYLLAAVERLKAAGYPVEINLLEGMAHDQIQALSEQADIAVDQLMIGAYGTVAIEMMAKGMPVVCRIRDDLRHYYAPDLPVISAEPGSIYDVLESLITQPERWADLGRRGVEYVRREHEMHHVAARALSLYSVDLNTDITAALAGAAPTSDAPLTGLRQS